MRFALLLLALAACAGAYDCSQLGAGKLRWSVNLAGATDVGDASHIVDGTIFVASGINQPGASNSTVWALDVETGSVRWRFDFPQNYTLRQKMPSAYAGLVFAVVGHGQVVFFLFVSTSLLAFSCARSLPPNL